MNAYELADELEIAQGNNNADEFIPEAIEMIRQQQAEIESLKTENQELSALCVEFNVLRKAQEK